MIRASCLRFVMATKKAIHGSVLERPKVKQSLKKVSKGVLSSESDKRPQSTQTGNNSKPKGWKLNYSSSAGSVNPNRNLRQRSSSSSRVADLDKTFQRLSVKNQKKPIRRFSSSSGTCDSLEDAARWILQDRSKKIVILAGAGISTPSGIPDFRTPGSGLYDNLQQYKIPYPEAIFDLMYFYNNPKPFFTLAKELYPGKFRPNYVHYFVRMLHEKGKLLRMYTQNIDGLERLAGIPPEKLVEAHGTFTRASCIRCQQSHEEHEIKALIMTDTIPRCKRPSCTGVVKPDIVFFGEDLPKRFFYYLKDLPQCDMVIIMGTSLEVYPFAGIVNSARGYIPRILINREAVGPFARPKTGRFNDLAVTGDLLENVQKFTRVLGWKKAMEDLIKENEALLDEKYSSTQSTEGNSTAQNCSRTTNDKHATENKSQLPRNATESENNNNIQVSSANSDKINANKPNSRSVHTLSGGGKNVGSGKKPAGLPNIYRQPKQTNNWRRSRRKERLPSSSESSETSSSEESDSSSDSS
ncbi:NAD-dependent protein deacetylase sirtuin-3-like isoform X2 [Apostichopus japonicus]|uniref:NAD-dependent protein deacetylase sirtuin-3-like isoform X2 n=1 Tax=Stichopus japonicus TaxID=307972 RepID=UPI003AB89CB9